MYKTLYVWKVNELLIEGEKVYCLNMETNSVSCLNELMVSTYFDLMAEARKDDSKYIFYYYEKAEENK